MRNNGDWLNRVMEIDHPVRVNEDGSVTDHGITVYAPESVIETTHDGSVLQKHQDGWTARMRLRGWEPLAGYSSEYLNRGAIMHACESIGSMLERDILATPGIWVAVTVECLRGYPDDAGEDYDPENHTCGVCADTPGDGEPAGWAVLHMDDGPETASYVMTATHPWPPKPADFADEPRVTLTEARNRVPFWGIAHFGPPRIVRVTDLAVMPVRAPEWESAGTEEPGDKQRDLDIRIEDPARTGFWGLIGPSSPDEGHDWSVIDGEDGETIASGHADDEDTARAAVAAWELRHSVIPAQPCTIDPRCSQPWPHTGRHDTRRQHTDEVTEPGTNTQDGPCGDL